VRGVFGWSRPFGAGVLPAELADPLRAARLVQTVSARDADDADDAEAEADHGGARAAADAAGVANVERALVRASTIGSHLYLHSAWPTASDDAVFFGPDTYRYVAAMERALPMLLRPVRRAVDIGAGAGPGAIELALRCPGATVYAADINPAALALAEVNAGINDAHNVVPCMSDLLDGIEGGFDVVMSNPPYILDPDERAYRHGGGEHGAALSIRIVKTALERLHPGGSLLLYTGVAIVDGDDRFLGAIRGLLDGMCDAWSYEELDPDIFGGQLSSPGYEHVERIAAVWLQATKRT
jgi:methylase of polypeptide subunit release factors